MVYVPVVRSIRMLHAVWCQPAARAMVRNRSWSLLPVKSWVTQGDIQIGPYRLSLLSAKRDVKNTMEKNSANAKAKRAMSRAYCTSRIL